ncbi:MAG: NAD(P)/FAD-dependent oxidoreductase [Ignavibacterium sp.]|jgi:NADH dehydrogenase|nr:NAD(P)/FAD-dependent oxidoreductase [Ignavibacterium sp.]
MSDLLEENIEKILDDFMLIEYKDYDDIFAREHYKEMFTKIFPFQNHSESESLLPALNDRSAMQLKKNIVIIGAGYGGLTAALRLEKFFRKSDNYKIHLIDKNPYHTLKTQLHEAAVRNTDVTIPLDRILKNKNIRFHLGEVNFIDVKNRIIHISDNTEEEKLIFEFLVIAIGSKINFYNIPGMKENSFALQTLHDADLIYEHISKICASTASKEDELKRKENLRFVIGGGGLSGVEFAGELADHTSKCVTNFGINKSEVEIIIIEAAERLVPFMDKEFSERVEKKLLEKGISILKGAKIIKRTSNQIMLSDGTVIQSGNFIWTGGIRVSDLLRNSGLQTGLAGKVMVNEFLQSKDDKQIYAIGDSANAINPVTNKPVPAAAQFALQQGRLVAKNILSEVTNKHKEQYLPKVMGEVVSLGRHLAVGWLALPLIKKVTFVGFLANLLKAAIKEKHVFLLRKESRNWIRY